MAKPEQEVGLDDLLAFAQEQVTEQLSEAEQLEERTEELQQAEKERVEEKSQLEKGEYSLNSGKTHYLELTNPKAYSEQKMSEIAEREKIVRESGRGYEALKEYQWLANPMNSVTEGRLWSEMPYLNGGIDIMRPRNSAEYLPIYLKQRKE